MDLGDWLLQNWVNNDGGGAPHAGFFEYEYGYIPPLANFQKMKIGLYRILNGSNLARSGCSVSVVANNWLRPRAVIGDLMYPVPDPTGLSTAFIILGGAV